ncbi:MAG: thioredoxin family protein [Fluviicola sp.]|nr:thioredoxin family protein [Fluviicola sp.]
MITRFTGILAVLLFSFATSAQEIDCEKVKDNIPTFIRSQMISIELDDSTRLDMDIFRTCGNWDSIDNKLFAWPNIINIIIDYSDIEEDDTYGEIMSVVDYYKSTEQYELDRNEIIESAKFASYLENESKNNYHYSTPNTELVLELNQENGVFYQLNDLSSALDEGKTQQKRVLIYFTAWSCANCRRLEDRILVDKEIQQLLADHFVCFSAYTDDNKKIAETDILEGQKNAQIQLESFKSISTPHLFILDENGKLISESKYVMSVDEFLTFLKKGLK